MHLNNVGPLWLRRYAVFVAWCTFVLVIAGGLVTSNDAALSVPDWPLSYGRLVPTLEGGIRYEFAHRVLAAIVGLLAVGLALGVHSTQRRRDRRESAEKIRRFKRAGGVAGVAWAAVGVVAAQAALGGATVKLVTPAWATIAHAALGQVFFALIVALCVGLYRGFAPVREWHMQSVICTVALFAQTLLGAGVRYQVVAPAAHIGGAFLATGLAMWAGLGLLMQNMDHAAIRRPAILLLSVTFSQVFLGIGAMMARVVYLDAPQPMPMMVLFTVAHVAVGSLAVGAGVALAMLARPGVFRVEGEMVTA
jgi:heme a synthase